MMFKNYIKTAFRNLIRSKIFSFINIAGFAMAICTVILILHYLQFHSSFNNFHKNSDRIFRVSVISERKGMEESDSYVFVPPLGPAMQKDFPEVEAFTRLREPRIANFTYNNIPYKVNNVTYADSTFFKVFSFKLVSGNLNVCLVNPFSIILTKSIAKKIFGNENPIGKLLTTADGQAYAISGIVEDPPINSDVRFGAIISFSTLYKELGNYMDWNGGNQYITYVLLKKEGLKNAVENKFPSFMWEYMNKDLSTIGIQYKPYLQPINEIHLKHNEGSKGLKTNIYIFSMVAGIILLLACINFINLFNSKAVKRNKEIGIRKVLGAMRSDVIKQFVFEALVIILISALVAVLLCAVALPAYNRFTNQEFDFAGLLDYKLLLSAGLSVVVTCLFASIYPSVVLSSFQPVQILRKYAFNNPRGVSFKGVLVVFQFVISISLITITFLIGSQLSFIKTKELGFTKENQLVVGLSDLKAASNYELIKNEILKTSGVRAVTATSDVPINGFTRNGYFPEGLNSPMLINVVDVDTDFFTAYNIPIVSGRGFIKDNEKDKEAYIINEAFARKMNWSNPIGKEIKRNGTHKVIGVARDFHFASLHDRIAPLIITNNPQNTYFSYITVKVHTENIQSVINNIKNVYGNFSDKKTFEYRFLDDALNSVYLDEIIFNEMFFYFSFLAIIIALIGVLGLSLFAVEQRKKEIAVRKIQGASVGQIIVLISRQFTFWVVIANIAAWPIAYLFVNKWLEQFSYKGPVSWIYFMLASVICLLTAFLITGYNSIIAAVANPVDSLRSE